MKPVLERHDNKTTLNLTIPFALWATLFLLLALLFQSPTLILVAVLPMLLWFGFFAFVWFVAAVGVVVFYLAGKPVEWTSGNGQVKTYQRKTR